MKKYLFTLLISLLTLPALAQTPKAAQDLQQSYQSMKDWKANFTQTTYVDLTGQKVQKRGTITVSKPGKLRIEYAGPTGRTYISNGTKLWVYTPGDSQVEVHKNVSKVMAKEALSFLQGLGNLQDDFKVSPYSKNQAAEALIHNQALTLLELRSRNGRSDVGRIVLGYDPKRRIIEEATLFNASGNKTHYDFRGVQMNTGVAADFFEFQKPKGVREIKS